MVNLPVTNSISGGRTSCFLAHHFPAELDLFALVEQQCSIYSPADRWWKFEGHKESFDWIRQFNPGFWSTAEDDRTLICLHELSKELQARPSYAQHGGNYWGVEVTCAHRFSGLINPVTNKRASSFDDFDTLIVQRNYLANARKRLCTQFLKVEPIFHHFAFAYPNELRSGQKVTMRIGFRVDEVERTIRLYFKPTTKKGRLPNPAYDLTASFNRWRLPKYLARWWDVFDVEGMVRRGELIEKPTSFNVVCGVDYRTPEFPLIEHAVPYSDIIKFWRDKPNYPFPPISNCVGCFHHRVEQLQTQWDDPNNWGENGMVRPSGGGKRSSVRQNVFVPSDSKDGRPASYQFQFTMVIL